MLRTIKYLFAICVAAGVQTQRAYGHPTGDGRATDSAIAGQSAVSLRGTDIYNGLRGENFNEGWKFFKGEVADGHAVNINDVDWQSVTLPHDWSIFNDFDPDSPAGGDGGYLSGGVGWYRKTFTLPADCDDKKVFVGFDGISALGKVWINGNYIAFRPNGYSSFQCDLTPYLNHGGVNMIAVRAHKEDKAARWYTGAGIYRNVWLTTLDPVHVDYCGVRVSTPSITYNTATVSVETTVLNEYRTDRPVSLEVTILTDGGGVIGKATSSSVDIPSMGREIFTNEIMLNNPRMWSTYDPYLYMVRTDVLVDGVVVDSYETTFGVRELRFDADRGFSLNGEPMKFNGVCLHSDLGCLGAAVNYRAIERQLQIMKNMGVNAIRTAHNFPDPQVLELCDRLGIMVLNEAYDVWRVAKNGCNDYSLYFARTAGESEPALDWPDPDVTWAEVDTKDWVKRDRNHPSVVMWSIGNEIMPGEPNMVQDAVDLKRWVKEMDPAIFNEAPDGRPVTWGNNHHNNPNKLTVSKQVVDIDGINYQNRRDQTRISYDIIRDFRQDQPLYASETCSNVKSRGIYRFPISDSRNVGGYPDYQASSYDDGNWLPSARASYASIYSRDYMMGEFVWTGFDYLGEPSPYGGGFQGRSSYFGIVDLAGFPKDIYYFYRSRWQNAPVLHLLPHWNWGEDNPPASQNGNVNVMAYTNCQKVELFLNGESLGERLAGNTLDPDWIMEWIVPWAVGTLEAKGTMADGRVVDCRITTSGAPASLELKPDRNVIMADGTDMSFVEVDVKDAAGVFVPTATDQVEFSVSGPGEIVGVDNGDATGKQNLKGTGIRAFSGKCLVVVRSLKGRGGEIVITARSNGLTAGMATVSTVLP